jgi:hypothetical protein
MSIRDACIVAAGTSSCGNNYVLFIRDVKRIVHFNIEENRILRKKCSQICSTLERQDLEVLTAMTI